MDLILQHFNGELRPLDKLSIENMKQYADKIGAEHKLITGKPFSDRLTNACQKVHCISEDYDEYDNVLMVDPDIFAVKGLTQNVFDRPGNGTHFTTQIRLKERLISWGRITNSTPYWAGSFYKFSREERKKLRDETSVFDNWEIFNEAYKYEDEGILSVLAMRAKLPINYIELEWNWDSFLVDPMYAKFIHIRTKISPNGPKVTKIENYQKLVNRGII
jgi:hypothetical protein